MKEYHFRDYTIIGDGVKAEVKLSKLNPRFKKAQWFLGEQVLQMSRAHMPFRAGILRQNSFTDDEGRRVVFNAPYARFLYYGKVMVDPETGSPWARRGAKKVVTDRDIQYSVPEASARWFEVAWAQDGKAIMEAVNRIMRGENG